MSKTAKTLFTLSVLLNVLLGGMLGGYAYKKYAEKPVLMREMNPQTRATIMRAARENRKESESEIKALKESRKELMKVMEAQSFDEAAYDKAMNDLLEKQAVVMKKRAESIRDIAAELKPEERKALARKFTGMMEGRRPQGEERRFPRQEQRIKEPIMAE